MRVHIEHADVLFAWKIHYMIWVPRPGGNPRIYYFQYAQDAWKKAFRPLDEMQEANYAD
jgi:hypothetical protein